MRSRVEAWILAKSQLALAGLTPPLYGEPDLSLSPSLAGSSVDPASRAGTAASTTERKHLINDDSPPYGSYEYRYRVQNRRDPWLLEAAILTSIIIAGTLETRRAVVWP